MQSDSKQSAAGKWIKRGQWASALALLVAGHAALAGGPRYVAGSSYFSAAGQPIVWANGQVTYFTDLSDLSSAVSNTQANAMVAQAAAVWSSVSTAAVSIHSGGSLAEYVDASLPAGATAANLPADLQPGATATPVGIVYDQTGAAIDAIYGSGASSPLACQSNGVIVSIDNFAASGNFAHALVLVNGVCATTQGQIANLQYQLVRAFGQVLGLDWSQANEEMFAANAISDDGLAGWPVMHPMERLCNAGGGTCMTDGTTLRTDDIAALNRLYPVTAANIGNFPGKVLTGSATISVRGTIQFVHGQGMQGVNVVLRPLVNGVPDVRYTATAVSGAYFEGNVGNPVTGTTDAAGNPLNRFGSGDPSLEGSFDLSGVPLPPGVTSADYQLSFEPVNPLYTGALSVGPYTTGQVAPSGTLPAITLTGLGTGSAVTQTVVVSDSARALQSGADGTEREPAMVPASGEWTARTTGYGHTGWFQLRTRAAREFTIEAQALDETGAPTQTKAQMVIGAWDGSDAAGTAPVTATVQPFNTGMPGLTALPVLTVGDSEVRIGFADFRGDGRPDFAYHGRILYADSVTPARLPVTGGQIVIRGMGFRSSMMVLVNGVSAQVTSVTPNTIVAIVPDSGGVTGTVPIQIEDTETLAMAGIADGFSYDAGSNDALALVSGPSGAAPVGVPQALTVRVINVDTQAPAAGVAVSFAVTQGSAALGCGMCTVTTGGDGTATVVVTPTAAALTQITASLANGSSVIDQFSGTASAGIVALTPNLYIAMGATVAWPVQAMVVDGAGNPVAGQSVNWAGAGVSLSPAQGLTGAGGVASSQIAAGPFSASVAGSARACMAGTQSCAVFQVIPVQPSTEGLVAWSGTQQYVAAGQGFAPVVLHVIDAFGNPVAGAAVTFEEAFFGWTGACPPQGSCPPAPQLAQAAVQATSGLDGSVTLTPLAPNGMAGRLKVTAVVGTSAVLNFEQDAHP